MLGSMFALETCLRSIQHTEILGKLGALLNNNRQLIQKFIYVNFSIQLPCSTSSTMYRALAQYTV